MRAWIARRHGPPREVLRIEEVPPPVVGPGELLIRVEAAPLNWNDIDVTYGRWKIVQTPLPFTPGMEVLGRVVGSGAGAERWLGQRVVAVPRGAFGGFAELAAAPADSAFAMPEAMSARDAAAIYFPFHLGWLALHERARLRAGETLLVHAGAGSAGSAAIQLGALAGARVIATAGSPAKLALCRSLGADLALDYRTGDFSRAVLEATGGRGVDVAFDAIGGAVREQTYGCMAFGGRHLIIGFAAGIAEEDGGVPARPFIYGNFSLLGVCHAYTADPITWKRLTGMSIPSHEEGERLHARLLALFEAGSLRTVIGREATFEELPSALAELEGRATSGRTIVHVQEAR
jgi:NADPH:quinone reductase-like Zn-dependent oxidoreductase